MLKITEGLRTLTGSRLGKIIPILAIAGLVSTASATVFINFYSNSTATVRANDLTLVAGSDASVSCSIYPCATVAISATSDYATVSLSFAKSVVKTPQPATYYTNLTVIHDATNAHSVLSVKVIPTITATSGSDFGKITVYYCTAQTNDPATDCANKLDITSTGSTGTIYPGTDALSAGNNRFIEVVAFAGSGATNGDTVVFNIQVQWA
ncbi:MAG: hypothetical protein HY247_04980 [archaeon]|nr:MAG: hypothetical protein HY247_04980 [archaeon]